MSARYFTHLVACVIHNTLTLSLFLIRTVTLFEAERPPIVALLCGSEGGMQRGVMCSYDWTTQTLYRETVLRMETKVLEKMSRIGRVRFGLRRLEGGLKVNDISPR